MMNIYCDPGTKIKYVHADDHIVNWGSNDDPRLYLTIDEIYTVQETEIHSWHTKVILEEFPTLKFNSSHFDEVEI
jgi:hypothetical protein